MYLEEVKKGFLFEIPTQKVIKEEMIEFSKKYDNIPLHTDEEYAKNTRFKKLIAPGIMSFLIVWSKFIEQDYFGEELIAGKSSKVEWFKPVFADDTLSGKIYVSNVVVRNDYNGIVETTMEVFNQDNELVLVNVTESILKRKVDL